MSEQEPLAGTAADMVAMLRRHYIPDGNRFPPGIFAPEIEAPDGRRRADLIWMPTTVANGGSRIRPELWGHEVKVTRQDVQVELADPTKAESWAQYCTRWWLVVLHPSLIEGLPIPEAWGVLAPPSGRRTKSMTVVRPAPELHPADPALALARLAKWQLTRHYNAEVRLQDELREANRQLEYLRQRQAEAETADVVNLSDPTARMVKSVLDQLTRESYAWTHGPEREAAVVAAILDLADVQSAARQLRSRVQGMVREVQAAADPFRQAGPSLAGLLRDAEALERKAS